MSERNVQPNLAALTEQKVKRKLAAIVSTDVKDYSRLMADDDVETVQSLKACRKLMAEAIAHHNGRVVDSPGDNLLSEFSSVTDAVQCAVKIQNGLQEHNKGRPDSRKMEFRIGINLGDVIEDGGQIFGDGINIAARLESIAPGGGICISGSAFEQVRKVLPLGFEFLGDKALKNISHPVPVYRVLTDPEYSGKVTYACAHDNPGFKRNKRLIIGFLIICLLLGGAILKRRYDPTPVNHPIKMKIREKLKSMRVPEKPSIAVLPFTNMSGDKNQEYFSDGLTEDLITDLSKISGLFVIARNSVFAYKGQHVQIDKVGRELGVRYVLEGSVRKVGNRVRITAQLIDAFSEGHVWAERYDRDLEDIFSVQDEVRDKIVGALSVQLTTDDQKRIVKKSTTDLAAYDYYLKGMELHATKMQNGLEKSKAMFQKAIDTDPEYARAYAALGHAILLEWIFGFTPDETAIEQAVAIGEQAIGIDPQESSAYGLLAHTYLWTKQHEKGIAEAKKAIALDPNNAEWIATLGEQLIWAGNPADGAEEMLKAMRLDPKYPAWYLWNLGHAYFLTGQYDLAVDAFERALVKDPNFWPSIAFLVLCHDELGNEKERDRYMKQCVESFKNIPTFSWRERLPYKDPSLASRVVDRLTELGL